MKYNNSLLGFAHQVYCWTQNMTARDFHVKTQFAPPRQTQRDRTVRKYSEHVQFQHLLSTAVLSCLEFNSHGGRRTDETGQSCRIGVAGVNWTLSVIVRLIF